MSDWANVLMLIVTIVAAAFAGWSALEARSARRVARSDFLKPYFDGAFCLWEPILGKTGRDEKQICDGKNGAASLNVLLGEKDKELREVLDWMLVTIDKVPNGFLEFYSQKEGNPPSYQIPKNAAALKEHFEAKRCEYLKIG